MIRTTTRSRALGALLAAIALLAARAPAFAESAAPVQRRPALAAGTSGSGAPAVEYLVGNRPANAPAKVAASGSTADGRAAAKDAAATAKIDLNTASEEELASLPGIGEARARSIVRNRPYARKDDLVRRKVIPKSVYEAIRERVIARR